MIEPPEVVETDEQHLAVIHLTVSREQIQEVMGPAIGEVLTTLTQQGVAPTGPVFTHHLRIDPERFDFEVGVPVAAPVAASGRVTPGIRPALRGARTVHRGPYEQLEAAWAEFLGWVGVQDLAVAEDVWETYLRGPEAGDDPSQWRTELLKPLA